MGRRGRERAVRDFAWPAIATETALVYARLAASPDSLVAPRD
jgi:hypothetical protein